MDRKLADDIIERLRFGRPPQRGVNAYTAGNEEFLQQVQRRHLNPASGGRGKIRFISGSWGSGKSHFLRQLREVAFGANYMVSFVELTRDETPFDKFEEVFYQIVRQVTSPEMYNEDCNNTASPLGEVFGRHLFGAEHDAGTVSREKYDQAVESLMSDSQIDIDVRRLIIKYWETFLPEAGDSFMLVDKRERIMQWFSGEGTIGQYRKEFGVQKLVNRSNAKVLLKSLARYLTHAGYSGLVILFDEAEMGYSVMKRSQLKNAHNNILHLINSIEDNESLFLVYATTPDFYVDEKFGVVTYGALAQRVGRPEDRPPRALDRLWNIDQLQASLEDYEAAAKKIRTIYLVAYPDGESAISSEDDLPAFVDDLYDAHPKYSQQGFWRVLVAAIVHRFDLELEGEPVPSVDVLHDEIIEKLREE